MLRSCMISTAARCSDVCGWGHGSLPAGAPKTEQNAQDTYASQKVDSNLGFERIISPPISSYELIHHMYQ